jgi:hypothetical protein
MCYAYIFALHFACKTDEDKHILFPSIQFSTERFLLDLTLTDLTDAWFASHMRIAPTI